jgi:hypothetical protein
MKYVTYLVAIATLAGAVAGCGSPYYPRSGYSQGYYQQPSSGYYQPSYGYYQPSYYSPGYAYR